MKLIQKLRALVKSFVARIRKILPIVVKSIRENRQTALAWIGLSLIGYGAWCVYSPAGFIASGLLLFIDAAGWMERKA